MPKELILYLVHLHISCSQNFLFYFSPQLNWNSNTLIYQHCTFLTHIWLCLLSENYLSHDDVISDQCFPPTMPHPSSPMPNSFLQCHILFSNATPSSPMPHPLLQCHTLFSNATPSSPMPHPLLQCHTPRGGMWMVQWSASHRGTSPWPYSLSWPWCWRRGLFLWLS